MHDLSKRETWRTRRLKGVAFEITELMFIRQWAEARNIRMVVRLDYGMEGEEFEEVVAFYPETGSACQLIMWRTARFVFVLPLVGCQRRYGTVVRALRSSVMAMLPSTILTDIVTPPTY